MCGIAPSPHCPLYCLAALYTLSHIRYAAHVLALSGAAVRPSPGVFGVPFLILLLLGLVLNVRQRRLAPLWLLLLLCVGQTAAMFVFGAYVQDPTFYLGFKMFYLLCYVLVLFVGVALDDFWRFLGSELKRPVAAQWPQAAMVLPVVAVLLAVLNGVPVADPARSYADLFAAAEWASASLPAGCVDYLVEPNEVAYWLHTAELGNARETPRVEQLLRDPDIASTARAYWSDASRLPYAIAADVGTAPAGWRDRFDVLYESGNAAVVQRRGAAACVDTSVPLDRVAVSPRGGLGNLLSR